MVWVAGCSIVLVLTVVGIGYVVHSLANGFRYGSFTCLPSDFPRYPGATFAGQLYQIGGTHPGNTCHIVFESNDDVETVTAFYQSKLNSGDWVTSSGNPAGQVSFQVAKNAQPFGTVNVAVSTMHTEITIDLFTSTCLPRNFPMYPGAKFGGQNYDVNAYAKCHIVFESTRSGSRQIWTMLADGTQARQLTTQAQNESPNWSPR